MHPPLYLLDISRLVVYIVSYPWLRISFDCVSQCPLTDDLVE